MSFKVVDNFLTDTQLKLLKLKIPNKSTSETWNSKIKKHFSPFITEAKKNYNLSKFLGFETWSHHNTKPAPHHDRDEFLYKTTGKLKFPLCSVIFYIEVTNLKGGKLFINDDAVIPKTNRLIIFGPGVWHSVEPFLGIRKVLLINPWAEKPLKYK
mgnify:FL=1